MMNFNIFRRFGAKAKNNRVGLDVGSSAVKMLEISAAGGREELVTLGLKTVSGAVRVPLVEAIKSLADEIRVTTKEAGMSVSGSSTIVRFVSMPRMREDELKGAIKFEAEKYIPFAINDCIVDYQILRKNEKENKLDILLVAVKKELVMERIAIAEESGFSVNTVELDTFAVTNAFLRNFPQSDPEKSTALLDIGAAVTNIGIVREGILCFARDIAIGGKNLAEDAKNAANNLLDEARLSFGYYENQSGRSVNEICISGGPSLIDGLENLFTETFEGLKPNFWDPLQFLDKTKTHAETDLMNRMKGSFAVAAGLALR